MGIILNTERLYLRKFEPGDGQLLVELNADPEVTRYVDDPVKCDTTETAEKVLREVILPQYSLGVGRWAVHLSDTREFIGWCGLKRIEEGTDLGYRYLKKFWGHGYGSEAAIAVYRYGVEILGLTNIIGRADKRNLASRKILEKTGLLLQREYEENNRISVFYVMPPPEPGF